MKIAVGTPEQVGEGWDVFRTDYVYPDEIRRRLQRLYESEDDGGPEVRIVTLSPTVLNEVTSSSAKMVAHVTFEDVLVFKEGRGLVPLLELHTEEWLSHSFLGSLLERCQL